MTQSIEETRSTFKHIAPEKRERVLHEAALIFAERGYDRTDMAAIANRCQIAKGSLYNYFENKQSLYLHVCRDGLVRSRAAVWQSAPPSMDIYALIDHAFEQGAIFAHQHPEYVALYLNMATAGLDHVAQALSLEVERPTAECLKRTLRDGIEKGTVDPEADLELLAWQINNSYVMFLAALVSRHFGLRMREYLQPGTGDHHFSTQEIAELRVRTVRQIKRTMRPLKTPAQPKRPIHFGGHGSS